MPRPFLALLAVLAASGLTAARPLAAQQPSSEEKAWRLDGVQEAFCVEFLLDPASEALKDLPRGYRAVPASEAKDLHLSLKSVVQGQAEFAAWSPSRLCFTAVDTVQSDEFRVGDKSGRHPQLFGAWTVLAAGTGASAGHVALDLFASSRQMIRSARLAGHVVREASLSVGMVPAEDENGAPSSDRRFQVRLGKATITWDGRPARDSGVVREAVKWSWSAEGVKPGIVTGEIVLSRSTERAMAGSLKVDGKDALAQALRGSPTRFAGPSYQGGGGSISFRH